jgi:hypothetical protein
MSLYVIRTTLTNNCVSAKRGKTKKFVFRILELRELLYWDFRTCSQEVGGRGGLIAISCPLKGTGSRDIIQIFGKKLIFQV